MKITIRIKEVYGLRRAYPMCDTAKRFAKLTGKKTLTRDALCIITSMGYSIEDEACRPFVTLAGIE